MKLSLDKSKCSGHARCHAVDAEFFPIDDLGYSSLEPRSVDVADEGRARDGVASCPEAALILDEE